MRPVSLVRCAVVHYALCTVQVNDLSGKRWKRKQLIGWHDGSLGRDQEEDFLTD